MGPERGRAGARRVARPSAGGRGVPTSLSIAAWSIRNRLIYWFNHYPEKAYDGPRFDLPPGAIVIGGGLASIDVVEVLQIGTSLQALRARGVQEDMLRLEREGLEPCWGARAQICRPRRRSVQTFLRRRVLDMPSPTSRRRYAKAGRSDARGAGQNPGESAAQVPLRVRAADACRPGSLSKTVGWPACR